MSLTSLLLIHQHIAGFIPENKGQYKLTNNFITTNLESCIEVNAHNMILLMRHLRNSGKPELFLPHLMSSQPCEETFRQMRSMGSVNYTKINFTLLDLFHLVGRIEIQNDIIHSKLANVDIHFPRNKEFNASQCRFQLPTDDEILCAMKKARADAVKDALNLGMVIDINTICSPMVSQPGMGSNKEHEDSDIEDPMDSMQTIECSSFPDFGEDVLNADNSGPFVSVSCSNGKTKVIRKSHLIWLLTDSKDGLSSDRLKRVQSQDKKNSSCRRLQFKRVKPTNGMHENEEIQIGDWCIFYNNNTHNCSKKFVFGSALGFEYIDGKNRKERKYTWDFAKVKPDDKCKIKRGIQVLALWYSLDVNGVIKELPQIKTFYIDIRQYVVTLSSPSFNATENSGRNFCFEKTYLECIQEDLLKLESKRTK